MHAKDSYWDGDIFTYKTHKNYLDVYNLWQKLDVNIALWFRRQMWYNKYIKDNNSFLQKWSIKIVGHLSAFSSVKS